MPSNDPAQDLEELVASLRGSVASGAVADPATVQRIEALLSAGADVACLHMSLRMMLLGQLALVLRSEAARAAGHLTSPSPASTQERSPTAQSALRALSQLVSASSMRDAVAVVQGDLATSLADLAVCEHTLSAQAGPAGDPDARMLATTSVALLKVLLAREERLQHDCTRAIAARAARARRDGIRGVDAAAAAVSAQLPGAAALAEELARMDLGRERAEVNVKEQDSKASVPALKAVFEQSLAQASGNAAPDAAEIKMRQLERHTKAIAGVRQAAATLGHELGRSSEGRSREEAAQMRQAGVTGTCFVIAAAAGRLHQMCLDVSTCKLPLDAEVQVQVAGKIASKYGPKIQEMRDMAARGASVRALADSASLVAGGLLRSLIAMSQHLPSYVSELLGRLCLLYATDKVLCAALTRVDPQRRKSLLDCVAIGHAQPSLISSLEDDVRVARVDRNQRLRIGVEWVQVEGARCLFALFEERVALPKGAVLRRDQEAVLQLFQSAMGAAGSFGGSPFRALAAALDSADPATLAGVRQCVLRTDQYLATSEFMRSLGYDVASPSREHWPEVLRHTVELHEEVASPGSVQALARVLGYLPPLLRFTDWTQDDSERSFFLEGCLEAAQLLALKVQLSDGLVPAEAKTEFEALRLASAGLAAALAKCSGSTWSASATMLEQRREDARAAVEALRSAMPASAAQAAARRAGAAPSLADVSAAAKPADAFAKASRLVDAVLAGDPIASALTFNLAADAAAFQPGQASTSRPAGGS